MSQSRGRPRSPSPEPSTALTIAPPGPNQPPPLPPPPPPAPHRQPRRRRLTQIEPTIITPPYPWSTDRPAVLPTLSNLRSRGITTISNNVVCRHCTAQSVMEFDLVQKFGDTASYIHANMLDMAHRAPARWTNPVLPSCGSCNNVNCVKPVIAVDHEKINWLFLFLGELLGCCTLEQLKYFCKQWHIHCTGAKDRLIYLTYMNICNQLVPDGPFQIEIRRGPVA